jgi:acetyl-CoA synthetase (ADP-forming)
MLIAVGQIGLDHPAVQEIDVNPVILAGARPVAADALIVLR